MHKLERVNGRSVTAELKTKNSGDVQRQRDTTQTDSPKKLYIADHCVTAA